MEMIVQVAQRGVITLPQALRKANDVKVGDLFSIIDLGEGKFLLSRQASEIDKIADMLRSDLVEKGETLESMLVALRSLRENDHATEATAIPGH